MKRKLMGIFVCMLMISSTTTLALTPFSKDEQQTKNQFYDTNSVPLPTSNGWMKTFGGTEMEAGYSVQQTMDGGYIIVGETDSFGAGGYDIWLIKIDANGNEQWNRTFGGADNDSSRSIHQTTDGGYIIIGTIGRNWDYNGDVWLIKTDADGNMTWNKTFGVNYWSNSVQQTTDGGYIILISKIFPEIWLIKTDSNGDVVWDKTFEGGGSSVQQTTDGGYIIVGQTQLQLFHRFYSKIWLMKTNSNGGKVWDKALGGLFAHEEGFSVQQTTDGGYIITGSSNLRPWPAGGKYHILLIKTNSRGHTTWTRIFASRDSGWGGDCKQTTDHGYIITGMKWINNNYYMFLIKTDRRGHKTWERIFIGASDGYSVQQTTDGGYIVTGDVYIQDLGNQMLLIKTNGHGKIKPLSYVYLWLERLFQRFPNAFPLLRQIVGY
jgi:hypothetical protein